MDSFSGCFFKMAAHPMLVLILEHPHVTSLHVVLVISFPLKNGLLLRSWRHYNLFFSIKLLRPVASQKWKSNFKWHPSIHIHHALPSIMHYHPSCTTIHHALPSIMHYHPSCSTATHESVHALHPLGIIPYVTISHDHSSVQPFIPIYPYSTTHPSFTHPPIHPLPTIRPPTHLTFVHFELGLIFTVSGGLHV